MGNKEFAMDNNFLKSSMFINNLSMNPATPRPSSYDKYLLKLETERRKQVIRELADNLRRSSESQPEGLNISRESSQDLFKISI